jgi:hypothetical protein
MVIIAEGRVVEEDGKRISQEESALRDKAGGDIRGML